MIVLYLHVSVLNHCTQAPEETRYSRALFTGRRTSSFHSHQPRGFCRRRCYRSSSDSGGALHATVLMRVSVHAGLESTMAGRSQQGNRRPACRPRCTPLMLLLLLFTHVVQQKYDGVSWPPQRQQRLLTGKDRSLVTVQSIKTVCHWTDRDRLRSSET